MTVGARCAAKLWSDFGLGLFRERTKLKHSSFSQTQSRESRGVETGDEGRERERAVCCEEMAFMIGEGCLMWHCGAVTAL